VKGHEFGCIPTFTYGTFTYGRPHATIPNDLLKRPFPHDHQHTTFTTTIPSRVFSFDHAHTRYDHAHIIPSIFPFQATILKRPTSHKIFQTTIPIRPFSHNNSHATILIRPPFPYNHHLHTTTHIRSTPTTGSIRPFPYDHSPCRSPPHHQLLVTKTSHPPHLDSPHETRQFHSIPQDVCTDRQVGHKKQWTTRARKKCWYISSSNCQS
jgi:hypothetical protein